MRQPLTPRVLVALCVVLVSLVALVPIRIGTYTPRTSVFWSRTALDGNHNANLYILEPEANATGLESIDTSAHDRPGATIQSRQAKDRVWTDAQKRGKRLLCMLADPSAAPQTPFKEYKELKDWGWRLEEFQGPAGVNHILGSVQRFFKDKNLSTGGPPNVNMQWNHDKKSLHKVDGKDEEFLPTGGRYNNVFNPVDGVIVAYGNYGPDWSVKHTLKFPHPPGAKLPYLKQLSITTSQQRGNLKYVLQINVENKESTAIISAAMKSAGVKNGSPPAYPGKSFAYTKATNPFGSKKKGNEAFEALVGSPNVCGVAWLLIQHFEAMGKKTIASVTVWDKDADDADQSEEFSAFMAIELKPNSEMPKLQ